MEIQEQKARFEEFKESYSDDFLDECLNDLKVSPKDRTNMKAALIGAGRTYILFDNLSNMYVPAREMRAKYDAIYKPLKKLKDTWLAVWENDAFDFCTLFTHAELQYSPNEKSYEANQLIKDFMRHETQNFHLAYGELIHFLDFLDKSMRDIPPNISGHYIKGVVPVEKWLRKLKPDWEKYSPVEFIAGINYGGDIGHNSEAIIILSKLMGRMHSDISKSRIGNTLERLIRSNWEKI